MLKNLAEVIPPRLRGRLVILLVGMVLAALLETIGLSSIPAFLAILLNPVDAVRWINAVGIPLSSDWAEGPHLIYAGAVSIAVVFVVKALFLTTTLVFEAFLMKSIAVDLTDRLFWRYVNAPYLFHVRNNSAFMVRNVTKEVEEVRAIIRALLLISRESLVLLAAVCLLVVTVPSQLGAVLAVFVGGAALFYFSLRRSLVRRGKLAQEHRGEQIKLFTEALGAIKILKLFSAEAQASKFFLRETVGKEVNTQFQQVVGSLPRVILETLGVGVVVGIAVWNTAIGMPGDQTLPALSLLGVVVVRLVPSLTTLTAAMSTVRFQRPSLDLIATELRENPELSPATDHATPVDQPAPISAGDALILRQVSFRYEEGAPEVLSDLNLELSAGQVVGIVGASGSGKSTLLDLMLNVIEPTDGDISFGEEQLSASAGRWRSRITYTPQDIYLVDDTLRRNIAFGVPDDLIDADRLDWAVVAAQLDEVVRGLPNGLNTRVGERGLSLSGGQRQRVGLARALFRQSPILILDEATSALDSQTEAKVLAQLRQASFVKLIIFVTHRLDTLRGADLIVTIDRGRAETMSPQQFFAAQDMASGSGQQENQE